MLHHFGLCLSDDAAVTHNQPPPDEAEPNADLTLQDPTGEPWGEQLIHTLVTFHSVLLNSMGLVCASILKELKRDHYITDV